MVDVLINCLLNREIAEELGASVGVTDRVLQIPDGDEGWKGLCDHHPLSAAANAMLNIGGGSSPSNEESSTVAIQANNPMSVYCEFYKVPYDKVDKAFNDKYGPLNDLFTTVATTSHAATVGGSSSASLGAPVPVSLLPQAAELLRNRRISDSGEVTSQDVDIYLNRALIKRESPEAEELIVPTSGVISSHKSSETTTKDINEEVSPENPESPNVPLIVSIKHEQGSLPTTPSPPVSNARELPPASSVIAQAYSSQVLPQGYENLAAQYVSSTLPQYQTPATTSIYMVASPPEYSRGLTEYYSENVRPGFPSTVATTVPAYTDATDTAAFVERYIRQANYKAAFQGITADLPSPDSGIGDTTINPREASGLAQV